MSAPRAAAATATPAAAGTKTPAAAPAPASAAAAGSAASLRALIDMATASRPTAGVAGAASSPLRPPPSAGGTTTAAASAAEGSGASSSPASRLHLHPPSSTPPRRHSDQQYTGSSILSAANANAAYSKRLFATSSGAGSVGGLSGVSGGGGASTGVSTGGLIRSATLGGATGRAPASQAVMSAAAEAFAAAKAKAAKGSPGPPAPGSGPASAAASLHRPLIPTQSGLTFAQQMSMMQGATGHTLGSMLLPSPPINTPTTSPPPSAAGTATAVAGGPTAPLALTGSAASTVTGLAGLMSAPPLPLSMSMPMSMPMPLSMPLLPSAPPLPPFGDGGGGGEAQQARKRPALNDAITQILDQLEARHGQHVQYHFLVGLQHLRLGHWKRAEVSLRTADELYAPTIAGGSLLQRIEREDSVAGTAAPSRTTSTAATPAAAAAATPTTAAATTSAAMAVDDGDELALTQPMDTAADDLPDLSSSPNPLDGAGAGTGAGTGAGAAGEQPARTPYVARKAADIKSCLAMALWKGCYYSPNRSSDPGQPDGKDVPVEAPLAEAKRLLLEALELEGGRRLSTWNHLCIFLFATEGPALASSLLTHVIASHQHRVATRAQWIEERAEEEQEQDSDDSGTGVDDLQSNLALLQLLSGDSAGALSNLQEVLLHTSAHHTHHLPALNNFALMLMKQRAYTEARLAFELLLRHQPMCAPYWNNLAVCLEMQLSRRSDPLALEAEVEADSQASTPIVTGAAGVVGTISPAPSSSPLPGGTGAAAPSATTAATAPLASTSSLSTSTPAPASAFALASPLPLPPIPAPLAAQRARQTAKQRDDALLKEIRYVLEKARFYESLEIDPYGDEQSADESATATANAVDAAKSTIAAASSGSAGPAAVSPAASPSTSASPTPPIPAAAPAASAAVSSTARSSCSWTFRLNLATHLLSLARSEANQMLRDYHYTAAEKVVLSIPPRDGNMAHVYALLGSIDSARSASSLAEGDMSLSRTYRAQAMSSLACALRVDPQSVLAWNQLALLCLQSGDTHSANPYWMRMVKQIKGQAGLPVTAAVAVKTEAGAEASAAPAPVSAAGATAAAAPPTVASLSLPVQPEEYPECSASDLAQLRSSLSAEQLEQAGAVLCNLAISLQLSNRLAESERAYTHSLLLRPDQAAVHMNKGNLHRQRGEHARALECFGRALALQPDYALAWSNLALLHIQRSDLLQGHYCMERAHLYAPASQTVRSNRLKLAIVWRRMGFVTPLPPPPAHFDPLASTPLLPLNTTITTTGTSAPAVAPASAPAPSVPTTRAAAKTGATAAGPAGGGGGGGKTAAATAALRAKRQRKRERELMDTSDDDEEEDEDEAGPMFEELMSDYVITK